MEMEQIIPSAAWTLSIKQSWPSFRRRRGLAAIPPSLRRDASPPWRATRSLEFAARGQNLLEDPHSEFGRCPPRGGAAARRVEGLEVSSSNYNLFDSHYGDPGAEDYLQDAIRREARSLRIKLTYRN